MKAVNENIKIGLEDFMTLTLVGLFKVKSFFFISLHCPGKRGFGLHLNS